MVIHINPNRINTPVNTPATRPHTRTGARPHADPAHKPPQRVEENYIPQPESLAAMIRNAVGALRAGVFWDRGTILNILA